MTQETDTNALDRALAILTEHFEAVTILVTRFDGESGNTVSAWRGRGNWHARYGQVREWVVKREAEARIEARKAMGGEDQSEFS